MIAPRRLVATAVVLGAALAASLLVACEPAPPAPTCNGVSNVAHRGQRYATTPGVAANLQSVDVYQPTIDDECPPAPVVIYVHGGGWSVGDKANKVVKKVDLLAQKAGWVFVSANYRLSPNPIDIESPTGVRSPTHAQDVAEAVDWVRRNAARFGGDPNRIALMGHSAGAHLVSLVGTDESFLADAGVPRSAVRCVVSLDTAAHDITQNAADNPLYLNAFGTDPAHWREASPIYQVTKGEALPDFLMVNKETRPSIRANDRFRDVLRAAGGTATSKAVPLSHEAINDAVGDPNDKLVTPTVVSFLGGCLLD